MRVEDGIVDFATNFVIEGRQTTLRLSEFEGADPFIFRAGQVTVRLEVLSEEAKKWKHLRTFDLSVSDKAAGIIPKAFTTYDNAASLPD